MPDRSRFRSLRSRFLAIALPLVAVASIGLLATAEVLHYRNLKAGLYERMERAADVNAGALAPPFWNLDISSIETSLQALVGDPDIVAVVASDPEGEVLARWGPSEVGEPGLSAVRPVRYRQLDVVHQVGWIEIQFTDTRLRRSLQRRIAVDGFLFAALLLVVFVSIGVAVRGGLSVPLERLLSSIRDSQSGRRRRAVDWASEDELGLLIQEYNRMLEREAEAEAETQRKSALLETTLHNIAQGLCVFDGDLRLAAFNDQYARLLDHPAGTLEIGMTLESIIRRNSERGEYGEVDIEAMVVDRLAIARSARSGGSHLYERERPDGTVLEVRSNPMPEGGFVSTYTDITERKQFEARMRHLALHDVLTGLPNRTLFHDRLEREMAVARRNSERLAVFFVDLDRFKDVNDTLGHDFGDKLLTEMAGRLVLAVRETDTAARLGGDEFGIIQGGLKDVEQPATSAERILTAISEPLSAGSRSLLITASVGVTLFPDDGSTPDELLKNADLAMYAAKSEGRNRYRYFLPSMDEQVRERRRLEEELLDAIEHGQLVLHYQPFVDLETGAPVSVEALVRWQHPTQGLLSPMKFLGVAEESGLIASLSQWVLGEACGQAKRWQDDGQLDVSMSLNLSPQFFEHPKMLESVTTALETSGLAPSRLQLEITEGAIMSEPERAVGVLERLRDIGVRIAVDDFGTGYSSLGYLRRFPLDTLKVDRSFVQDLPGDESVAVLVRTIIGLSHSLGLEVVAEGVELLEQAEFLYAEGCRLVQGFYFAHPLPADEVVAWARDPANLQGIGKVPSR